MLTLLSTLLGFAVSFIPRLMGLVEKLIDNRHELKMIKAKGRKGIAEITIAQIKADNDRLLKSMQGEIANVKYTASWINSLRSSVRPIITYLFFSIFITVEVTAIYLGVSQGADWASIVSGLWTEEINAIFASIIAFHFGSRLKGIK